MKYRKKATILVEAEQWFPGKQVAGVIEGEYVSGDQKPYAAKCPTLEGVFGVSPGDWILTGVKGERWPVKPDIFQESYEEVHE